MTLNSQTAPLAFADQTVEPSIPESRGCRLRLNPAASLAEYQRLLRLLRRRGFNLLIIDGLYDGYPVYPSEQLKEQGYPWIHPSFKRTRDLFHQVVKHALDLGFLSYVRAEMLKVKARGQHRPHPILAKNPTMGVRDARGTLIASHSPELHHFLCPANQAVRILMGDLLFEMLSGLPFTGIILGDIGFPPSSLAAETAACFCESCCTQVNSDLAIDLASSKLAANSTNHKRWSEWRAGAIERMVKGWKLRMRKSDPGMIVGAEIQGGFASKDQAAGQLIDWRNLTAERLVDFITPVYSAAKDDAPWSELGQDLPLLPPRVIALPTLQTQAEEPILQGVENCREHPLAGFIIDLQWPQRRETPSWLESLDLSGEALVVEADPMTASLKLIEATAELLPDKHDLRFFLSDVQRLLEKREPFLKSEEMLENIINNFDGLRRMVEDHRLPLSLNAAQVGRNMSLIQRLLELVAVGWTEDEDCVNIENS